MDTRALEIALELRSGTQEAIRFTKHALNYWYRAMGPAFEFSNVAEQYGVAGPDIREGLAALREKRRPNFA